MPNPRPPNNKTHPGPTSQPPISARGITSRLLIPKTNKSDSEIDGLFCDFGDGDADQAEDGADFEGAEG